MKDLLSHGAESLLQRYAWSNTLLAFDFDGTLAPIVARAETAQMRATTRTKLTALAQLYPCVVISGRGLADVRQRLAGVPLAAVVGNHGLDPSQRMVDHARTAREWLPRLQQRLRVEPGVEIEDKRYSLAIHYRRSRSKRLAHLLITLAVAELCPDARSIAGKQVVNVVPPGAPHKGIALERLREDTHTDTAIYVGDDVTDEDVFALDQPGQLLSIRIGKVVGSAASYYLRRQAEIDHLLDLLIVLRPQPVSRRVEDP